MQQDDGSIVRTRANGLLRGSIGRLRRRVPVCIRDTPQRRVVAERLRPAEIIIGIRTLRRTIERRDAASGQLPVLRADRRQLGGKARLPHLAHVGMIVRMVADEMTLVAHAPDKCRSGLEVIAHDEERAGNVLFLEGIQYFGSISVLVAAVKRKIQRFLVRAPHIIGAVFCERLHGILAVRGLMKAVSVPETPVGRSCREQRHTKRERCAKRPFTDVFHAVLLLHLSTAIGGRSPCPPSFSLS